MTQTPDYNLFKERLSTQQQQSRYWWLKRTFLIYKILRSLSALAVLLLLVFAVRAVLESRAQRMLLISDKTAVVRLTGNAAFFAKGSELSVSAGSPLPDFTLLKSSDGSAEVQLCRNVRLLFEGAFEAKIGSETLQTGTQKNIQVHLLSGAFTTLPGSLPKGVNILFICDSALIPWDGSPIKAAIEKDGFQARITGNAVVIPRSVFNLNLDSSDLANARSLLEKLRSVKLSSTLSEPAVVPRFITVSSSDFAVLDQISTMQQFDDVVRRLYFSGVSAP